MVKTREYLSSLNRLQIEIFTMFPYIFGRRLFFIMLGNSFIHLAQEWKYLPSLMNKLLLDQIPQELEINIRKKLMPRKKNVNVYLKLWHVFATNKYIYYFGIKALVFFAFVYLGKSVGIMESSLNVAYGVHHSQDHFRS